MSFYAELLPSIGTISVSIILSAPVNSFTKASVAADGRSMLLQDGQQSMTVHLPAPVRSPLHASITDLPIGQRSLTFRLPAVVDDASDNYTPWSASELSTRGKTFSFSCRACNVVLVRPGQIKNWKDLPSESWAELMDFWHCHKPPSENGSNGKGKYSAFEKGYSSEPGTALVQGGYFLLSPEDCCNVEVFAEKTPSASRPLICQKCAAPLGSLDKSPQSETTRSWRLDKWNLRLNDQGWDVAHPLESFLAARLIAIAEDDGVRRIYVTCEQAMVDGPTPALKLWLFNTSIRYTYTGIMSPIRGAKVLFQRAQQAEVVSTDQLSATSYESVVLVPSEYNKLQTLLEDSNKLLPTELGTMMDWKVGALRRFEIGPQDHGY